MYEVEFINKNDNKRYTKIVEWLMLQEMKKRKDLVILGHRGI